MTYQVRLYSSLGQLLDSFEADSYAQARAIAQHEVLLAGEEYAVLVTPQGPGEVIRSLFHRAETAA